MIFEVLTLFPEGIEAFAAQGLLGKALKSGKIALHCVNYREFSRDPHRKVDDIPYGGGAGMVMSAQPVLDALEAVEGERGRSYRILLSPSGRPFTQRDAEALAQQEHLSFLCGRYEGIDDRIREAHVDACFSLGDFILNGGEVAALAMIEAVARLKEGVLGNPASIEHESFAAREQGPMLEHPQYTRPAKLGQQEVPALLLEGNHAKVEAWRRRISLLRSWVLRPELRRARKLPLQNRGWIVADAQLAPKAIDRLRVLAQRHRWRFALLGPGPAQSEKSTEHSPLEKRFDSLKSLRQYLKRQGPPRILEYRSAAWVAEHRPAQSLPDLWQKGGPQARCQATQLQWAVAMDDLSADLPEGATSPVAISWPAEVEKAPDGSSAKVDLFLGVADAPAGIDLALCQRMIESPESITPWEAICDRLEPVLQMHAALVSGSWKEGPPST